MQRGIKLYEPDFIRFDIYFERRVEQVRFKQIVIANMYKTVFYAAFHLMEHRRQVRALKHVVHVKTIRLHVLHEVLCGVPVVPDLQRKDLIILDQLAEPVVAVVIIDEVLAGSLKYSPVDICLIRYAVAFRCFLDLFAGKISIHAPRAGSDRSRTMTRKVY